MKHQSRHSKNTKYRIFIEYLPNTDGYSSIIGWICTCKVGHRTVGCCSHIATLILYLSHAKYKNDYVEHCKKFKSYLITISKESEESDGSDLENDNLNNSTEDLRQKK